ncbi:hypothetical protein TNCV_3312721 [Trichonephila clavipes]|nr:hypothetical protein TNCV_3312721 [Trichonephila clavipes]
MEINFNGGGGVKIQFSMIFDRDTELYILQIYTLTALKYRNEMEPYGLTGQQFCKTGYPEDGVTIQSPHRNCIKYAWDDVFRAILACHLPLKILPSPRSALVVE